jgi:pSer/pThr/pTyr-binding forkhead associated (FHA) protein
MTASGTKLCAKCGGALNPEGQCSVCGQPESLTEENEPIAPGQARQADIYQFANRRDNSKAQRTALLFNKNTSERFVLTHSVCKIGRDQTNNISITDDHYISRHHAWVLQMQGGYWVEDLGSTNGTLLNGELLSERRQIFAGDRLTFGKTEFVFAIE